MTGGIKSVKGAKGDGMVAVLINNDEQYNKYLQEVDLLMNKDPDLESVEGERLLLLALAIKEYEGKHFFFKKPSPIDAIRFRMEEQDLKQNDLIPYIGSKGKVSEILAGKKRLTLPMIRALNQYLNIPLEILVQDPKKNASEVDALDASKFPFLEMVKKKWISATKSQIDDSPQAVLASFFEPIGGLLPQGGLWRRPFYGRGEGDSNNYKLIAWAAQVMILAEKMKVGEYVKSLITMDYLRELAKLSQFEMGPLLARELLAKNGIKLVFLKCLSNTKIDGGCFLDNEGHPVIGMTLRFDRIDYFWHTLLHEMSHVYKHLNSENQFIDNLEIESDGDPKEREADKLAREAFIPRSIWTRSDALALRTNAAIEDLAKKINIHPAIIAGRIRFETNDYSSFSDLIGQGCVRVVLKEYINE